MKRTLSFILSLIMVIGIIASVPVSVSAASVDDLTFELNEDGNSYSVTDCNSSASGELAIPSTYKGLPVRSIGDYAFEDCTSLTSVIIPDSVTNIGHRAFYGCTNLDSITLSESVTSIEWETFGECTSLESINIPDSVESICDSVFYHCTSLNSITIPDSVTSIGSGAFSWCTSLASIEIPDSVTSIGDSAFNYCGSLTSITIPDSVVSIGNRAFESCMSLESINVDENNDYYYSVDGVLFNKEKTTLIQYPAGKTNDFYTIPDNVTNIWHSAFSNCRSITSIKISDSVTSIGNGAFSYCENLKFVTIPDSVSSIGESTFQWCTNLESIIIPDSVTSIEDYAFEGCVNLTSITIPDSVKNIGDSTFSDTGYYNDCSNWENDVLYIGSYLIASNTTLSGEYEVKEGTKIIVSSAFSNCTSLEFISIPDSVVSIGDSVFYHCTSLNSITIPDSVTSLGGYVFYDCSSLSSVEIGNNVTSIGDFSFHYCSRLTSVSIPNSVKNIGYGAFSRCTSLTSIKIPDSVEKISSAAFNNTGYYNNSSNWENNVLYIGNHLIDLDSKPTISGEYVIREGTKTIAGSAFCECTNLESIIIPDGVTSIGDCAFSYCEGLKFITIPKSITYIDDYAFNDCANLKSVLYEGSQVQWEDIIIGSGNISLESVVFHYNSTGHTTGDWIIDKNATVYAPGSKHKECTECKEIVETAVIPQLICSTPKLSSIANATIGVKVSWGKVSGADSYTVYRKTAKSGWSNLGTVESTFFTDITAKSGTTYYYTVRAKNEAGLSGFNKTGIKINCVATPKLSKIANGKNYIQITWSKVSGADGYVVYRKASDATNWSQIATVKGGSKVSYKDTKVSSGKSYTYTVKAYDGSTKSSHISTGISIKFLSTPKLVSAKSAKAGVTVKWGKVAGAEGYLVYRKTGKASWSQVGKVEGNSTFSYIDASAKKGKTYTYTVRAYSSSYKSAYNTKGLTVKDKY